MWIIRFHKIKPRDYNYVARELKKSGFIPRKITPILFIKAAIYHKLQKKSWRATAERLNTRHVYLFNFYKNIKDSDVIERIFHKFAERRIIVYIGNTKTFTQYDLDNSSELLELTRERLRSIF